MSEEALNIRAIQHYMYCPRRFGLLENNCDWEENAAVVKANIMHEHVHDGSHSYDSAEKCVRSSVAIYNDKPEYNIFGVADCIEFIRRRSGFVLVGIEGNFAARIIEYKPRKPKDKAFNETDAIQVFAQKICADFVWGGDSEGYIYYSDVRRRVKLPFKEEFERYDSELRQLLSEMREIKQSGIIPSRRKGQKCSGCSLENVCLPKEKKYSVREEILKEFAEVGD